MILMCIYNTLIFIWSFKVSNYIKGHIELFVNLLKLFLDWLGF